jgi:hypothetical protein
MHGLMPGNVVLQPASRRARKPHAGPCFVKESNGISALVTHGQRRKTL